MSLLFCNDNWQSKGVKPPYDAQSGTPAATGQLHALVYRNATQGLLGRLHRAGAARGFHFANLVGVAGHDSYRHLQLVGGLPQRVVLTHDSSYHSMSLVKTAVIAGGSLCEQGLGGVGLN